MSESDSVLFNVDINNYNGPLDVLLDLAKAQKVDLEEISITKLADQFHDYITSEKDLTVFSLIDSFKLFIERSSEIKIFLKPIIFLI